MMRACSITGEVVKMSKEGTKQTGLGGILIKIVSKSTGKVFYTYSNDQGEFSFHTLFFDTWTLYFSSENLPARHYYADPILEVTLKPGENKNIEGRVFPQDLQIKIIDREILVLN